MSQTWKYAAAAAGLGTLFVLGWGVTAWLQRSADPTPPIADPAPGQTIPGGGGALPLPAHMVPLAGVQTAPASPAILSLERVAPATGAGTLATRMALAPRQRGRIMDVSQNPAFAGLSATAASLHVDAAPAEATMQALYQSLGIPLPPNGRASTFLTGMAPMTLHKTNAEYLDVLLEFSAQSNARLRNLTSQMLEFSPLSTGNAGPAAAREQTAVGVWCVAGPFAITLDNINTSESFPVGGPPASSAYMMITTLAEPKLNVASYPHQLRIESFVDDTDKPIVLSSAVPMGSAGVDRTPSTARYDLQLPPNHGHRIALLRGTAPFTLLTDSVTLDVPLNLAQTRAETVGGMKVEFLGPEAPRGAGTPVTSIPMLRIRLSRGDMPLDKWQAIAPVLPGLPIQALGGTAPASPPNVRIEGAPTGRGAPAGVASPPPDSITLIATFGRSNTVYPQADHAVFSIPTAIREVPVPFEFRDLILP